MEQSERSVFLEELKSTEDAVRRELASKLKVSLMHLEAELTPEYLSAKLLIDETGPIIKDEINKFRNRMKNRIKLDKDLEAKLKERLLEIADKALHKIFKRYMTEFAEFAETRVKLLYLLWRQERASQIDGKNTG